MKVILKEDVKNLGSAGDVKEVKKGHAENFLIPRNLALIANDKNMKVYEQFKRSQAKKFEKEKEHFRQVAEQIAGITCNITVQAGEDEKLYGSVSSVDIAEALAAQGFEVDRHRIVLEQPIKALGVFTVPIRFSPENEASVKVWIVREGAKAT